MVKFRRLKYRHQRLLNLLIGLIILLVLNYFSSLFFIRYDLTSEKRYTLSPITKSILQNLDKAIFVEVYLDGDLPSGFKRLQTQTKELIEEFQAYSGKIHYQIVNPLAGKNPREQQQILQFLSNKGLQATNLQVKTLEGTEQKLIIPGAILGNGEKEIALSLLNNQIGVPPETILNNSIQSLEYELINAIRKLSQKELYKVAILSGHGALNYPFIVDIALALDKDYELHQPIINGELTALLSEGKDGFEPRFNTLVIAKPNLYFNEKDKFVIDQFVMHGGNILWLIDAVQASMDSLQMNESMLAFPYDLNLDDLFFTYGIRFNNELIMDMNALPIPLKTGQIGNQPQIEFFPWPFYPVIHPLSSHPIVRNLNAIKTEFTGNLDTIGIPNVKKTILLKTSNYSAQFAIPNTISLTMIDERSDPGLYNSGPQSIAVLSEGQFTSVFKNRVSPVKQTGFVPKEISEHSKMIFIADGDIIKNQLHVSSKEPLPLGYDQYTQQSFGNKEFILNAISYLNDGGELIRLRSRELKLRLLDKAKVKKTAMYWKVLNTMLPLLLVVMFGVAYHLWRRKNYIKK